MSQRDYETHITNRIHRRRDATVPLDYTSVSLRFEYAQFGQAIQNLTIVQLANLNGKVYYDVNPSAGFF